MSGSTITPEELVEQGGTFFNERKIDSALEVFNAAVSQYREAGNYKLVGFTLATLALRLQDHSTRIDEALKTYEQASDAFSKAGMERDAADTLFSAGILAAQSRRKTVAATLLAKVGDRYEELAKQERKIAGNEEAIEIATLAARAWKEAYLALA